MQEQTITKKDWELFKIKIAGWQEAYMDRLNQEYIELLSKDANPSEKFWSLEKRIMEDKKRAGVRVELRRSKLIYNMVSLVSDGVISYEDLNDFSDDLKKTIRAFSQ